MDDMSDETWVEAADRHQFEMDEVLTRAEVAEAKLARLQAELAAARAALSSAIRFQAAFARRVSAVEALVRRAEASDGPYRNIVHVYSIREALESESASSDEDLDGPLSESGASERGTE